jgi:hypothetical protein
MERNQDKILWIAYVKVQIPLELLWQNNRIGDKDSFRAFTGCKSLDTLAVATK